MRPAIWLGALTASALLLACLDSATSPATPTFSPAPSPETGPPPPVSVAGRTTFFAADPGDSSGAVAVGDFNGDGTADLVLAAGFADGPDNGRPDAGEAHLFLGPFQAGEDRDVAAGQFDAIIYGANEGDQLGRALTAGDVNGDGIDDIILAAPFADGPDNDRQEAGEVYAILGSPSLGTRLTTIDIAEEGQDMTVFGADAGDLAGFALAADDLGGETADDLIIGAFWADGPDNQRPNAGEVYVIFDDPSGQLDLASPPDSQTTVYGAESEDRLGESVGTGDLDGDGRQDLIVPAPFADGPKNSRQDAGEVYVMFAPLPQTVDIGRSRQDVTILGVDAGDQIGHSLASSDVTGDGIADLLLTALSSEGLDNATHLAGESYLLTGGRPQPSVIDIAEEEAAVTIYGSDATDRLGRSAAAGDANGDGRADLLLAAPGADGQDESKENAGEIYLFYGRPSYDRPGATGRQADLTLEGVDSRDILGHEAFGTRPLLMSDLSGDALSEVIVSAPWGDGPENERPDAGEAYIFFVHLR